MANEAVKETFEVYLGFDDFISGLTKLSNKYNQTIKDMSKMGSNIGKTVVESQKQVNNAVVNLGKKAVNEINNTFSNLTNNLNESHNKVRSIQKRMERDLEALPELRIKKAKFDKDIKDIETQLKQLKTEYKQNS